MVALQRSAIAVMAALQCWGKQMLKVFSISQDRSKELVLITDLGLKKFLIGSTIDELP
jgi:hypothetical protein